MLVLGTRDHGLEIKLVGHDLGSSGWHTRAYWLDGR
jgi:hypothetical protein